MNIFRLSLRNMASRPLSTTLSLILLTLGVGMITLLLQMSRHIQMQMENNIRDIDMVVGAKGSPLQLILSAVYHIDAPTGNISLAEAKSLEKNRLIASAVPLSYGDSHQGFRIVGTTAQYPELYQAKVAQGRLWEKPFEVTIGATIAQKLGTKIGDTFTGTHGLTEGGESHDSHAYQVVGVLGYTNSVIDQLILTSTESVWAVHHHEEEDKATASSGTHDHSEGHEAHDGHAHGKGHESHEAHNHDTNDDADQEITAMLIKFRSPMGMVRIPNMVNEKTNMQAALPVYEIERLFNLMGVGVSTLTMIALVIMAVSGLSVFISLYSALKDRQYELALIRTYGATRWQLVALVVQEGLTLTLLGFVSGFVVSRLGLWLVSSVMQANYHYNFSGWAWIEEETWLFATALSIGLLASLIPAIQAFRINISKTLAND